jgi:propionyl-CoA synthetase
VERNLLAEEFDLVAISWILRGTMKKIADDEPWTMPATIDDPAILDEIVNALKGNGVGI